MAADRGGQRPQSTTRKRYRADRICLKHESDSHSITHAHIHQLGADAGATVRPVRGTA